jgi:hypothetical protein
VLHVLVTAYIVLSFLILSSLRIEEIRYSETSVLTRATKRRITEDGIFHVVVEYVNTRSSVKK